MEGESLPVLRTGPDRVRVRLSEQERRILASLVAEYRAELDDPAASATDGPLARLYPRAFPDDAEAEASYADLVHADLADGRRERLDAMEATLDAEQVDDATAAAWLGTLNDLRLVLGAALGIREDDEGAMPDPDDPDALRKAIFAWLGFLVALLVEAQAATLPRVPDEEEPPTEEAAPEADAGDDRAVATVADDDRPAATDPDDDGPTGEVDPGALDEGDQAR